MHAKVEVGAAKKVTGTTLDPGHYRPDIDGLRAVAVLSVIVFHYFPTWLPGGLVGVDIFFVISGYLISGHMVQQLEHNNFSILRFYGRRVRRIFPALILVLVACLCFGFFALYVDAYGLLGKHVAAGASFVANIVLWSESGGFEGASNFKPLLHLWSLGVEEQFYIVWPLAVWFAWRVRLNIFATIAVVLTVSFAANLAVVHADRVSAFYLPVTRFWELLAGAGLAEVERRYGGIGSQSAAIAASAGILLLGISFFVVRLELAFPGAIALLPVAGAVLVIASGREVAIKQIVLNNRIAVAIGLISYPLYLWHWPLISFGYILNDGTPPKMDRIGLLAVSFVLATATYFFVEKPIRFGRFKASPVALPLCSAMCMLGIGGYLIYAWAGFPNWYVP